MAAAKAGPFQACSATAFAENSTSDEPPEPVEETNKERVDADIWHDKAALHFLRNNIVPEDRREASRVRKRALLYTWRNNRLFRRIQHKQTGSIVERLVLKPSIREQTILDTHAEIGHLGEKRTIAAMSNMYWWPGMATQVRDLLKTCVLCQRVGVTAPHTVQDMQTRRMMSMGCFIGGDLIIWGSCLNPEMVINLH